jgi:transcription antitermination factor NusG
MTPDCALTCEVVVKIRKEMIRMNVNRNPDFIIVSMEVNDKAATKIEILPHIKNKKWKG